MECLLEIQQMIQTIITGTDSLLRIVMVKDIRDIERILSPTMEQIFTLKVTTILSPP